MFIAIEMKEKVIAHALCNRLPNNQRMLDYLVSNTKELEKYRTNVQIRPVILPVMQQQQAKKRLPLPLP